MLFHVSEEPDIERFEPRSSDSTDGLVVWAIDDAHLRNYLLPRDCPRVTFATGPHTTANDTTRFLGESSSIIAIESDWIERLRNTRLYCYGFDPASFSCRDAGAGYFVSREPAVPVSMEAIASPHAELRARGVDLRVLPELWSLHDAVVASTLEFSMIRMRNARPRSLGTA